MDTFSISDIPSETVRRITIAAGQLYEEAGKNVFPNVDAVRRRARVNMNDASNVMRVWRRAQTAVATPIAVAIPVPVQEASNTLLAAVWNAAMTNANANLQAAQTGWELERAEAEACRHQLATAFDQQTEEQAAAHRIIEKLEQQLAGKEAELASVKVQLGTLAEKGNAAEARAANSEARTQEILKRVDDLKAELGLTHANATQERTDGTHRLDLAHSTIRALNDQLRQRFDIDATVRAELAQLRGQLETKTAEHKALLATPKPNGEERKSAKAKTPDRTKPMGAD